MNVITLHAQLWNKYNKKGEKITKSCFETVQLQFASPYNVHIQ